MNHTVALVGAYERDNFGDLLFAYVTQQFLSDFNVILTAPLAGSVDELMPSEVRDFREAFNEEKIDAVWSVGGQLGGARPHSPILNYPGKAPGTAEGLESPYLPRMSQFPKIQHVPYIVNSIDVRGIEKNPPLHLARVKQALAEASAVSVRNNSSVKSLRELGLNGNSAPDVVQSLPLFVPKEPTSDTAMIQFNSTHFSETEIDRLAELLADSASPISHLKIVFWAAGVAPHHDSLELYDQVAHKMRALNPDVTVSVLRERHPLELVKAISAARLAIGSSLHARIVASAYGIPRLSWARPKLRDYCRDWDAHMPIDTTLDNLYSRIEAAFGVKESGHPTKLMNAAASNARSLVDVLHKSLEEPVEKRLSRRLAQLNDYATTLQKLEG